MILSDHLLFGDGKGRQNYKITGNYIYVLASNSCAIPSGRLQLSLDNGEDIPVLPGDVVSDTCGFDSFSVSLNWGVMAQIHEGNQPFVKQPIDKIFQRFKLVVSNDPISVNAIANSKVESKISSENFNYGLMYSQVAQPDAFGIYDQVGPYYSVLCPHKVEFIGNGSTNKYDFIPFGTTIDDSPLFADYHISGINGTAPTQFKIGWNGFIRAGITPEGSASGGLNHIYTANKYNPRLIISS